MVEALSGLCNDGGLPHSQRKFVVKTGMGGATLFSEAVKKDGSGWTQFILDNSSVHVVERTSSELHEHALKAGFQFTEFLAPNGIQIKVEVDPCYDDRTRNKLLMPGSTLPAESFRFDIMDMGTTLDPNIQLVKIQGDQEVRSIVSGIRDAWTGRFSVENAATDKLKFVA